ncbi:MAG TPA: hypothetical protein VK641_16180, partial [Terriglobales bacterium]|nr:hypothetical protein [Terriglobales bacterium]
IGVWLLSGSGKDEHIFLDLHALLYAVAAILIGFQVVLFAVFTKIFAITEGLHPHDPKLDRVFQFFNLEKGLLSGAVLLVIGLAIAGYSLILWNGAGFGPLNPVKVVRLAAVAITMIVLGVETIFSSFFLSILGLTRK